jgi:hypothetical protein
MLGLLQRSTTAEVFQKIVRKRAPAAAHAGVAAGWRLATVYVASRHNASE